MKALCLVIIYLLFVGCLPVYAQGPVYKNYTTSDGLASNTVFFAMQDSHGFIWFATDNGVSRFDGTRFKNYTVADGLSDNTVLKISEDAEGRVWFLTFNGKLSFFQNNKIYNSFNNELLKKIDFNGYVNYFFQDSKKNIWISSIGEPNLVCISPANSVRKYKFFNDCQGIMEDKHGQIRFLFRGAIALLTDTGFKIDFFDHIIGYGILLPCDTLLLASDSDGLEFINFKAKHTPIDGIGKYNSINGFFAPTHNKKDIWFTTSNGAVEFENGIISAAHEQRYLENYSLTSVLTDKDGNLWFSSIRSGVFMIPSPGIHLYDMNSGLADNAVTAIALLRDSSLMVGTFNGNLQLIEHGVIKNFHLSLKASLGEILCIKEDKTGTTWILTGDAVYIYRAGKFSTVKQPYNKWNKTLFIAHDRVPWIGKGRGLDKIINDSALSVIWGNGGKEINRIYAIEQVKDNEFLLGTNEGLYQFKDGNIIPYGLKDTLLTHWINALAVSSDSTVWIATDAYGLLSLKNDKVTQYTTKDRLLSNKCNNLFADSNKVYVATNNGLNVVSEQNNRVQISSYSLGTGLISNHINQVIRKNKYNLILATDHGVVEFDIRDIPVSSVSISYIYSLLVNDSARTLTNTYRFNHSENNINIEFGAINFNSAGNIYYRYKLVGEDTGWNYTIYTAIKYSQLHPGNYRFIVAAQNTNGDWNPQTASINFYIETPWWQTWWFRLIAGLIVTGIIGLVIRWRLTTYKQKIDQQRALSESELKALRAQINPHFIYNSLSAIQELVLHNQKEDANIYFSKFASLLRSILNNSRASEITLMQEMDSMKLYLDLEVLLYDFGFDFQFDLDKEIDPDEVYIPSMILQPYIENAVLHGIGPMKKRGKLIISFKQTAEHIICVIEDNGIGRKKAAEAKQKSSWQIHPSLGMSITQERIDLINTRQKQKINLEITDLADETGKALGTRVTIYFPLDKTGMN